MQSVVDEKHKRIVDFEVSACPDDKGALPKITESAKEIMDVDKIAAVADKGYYDGGDIGECEQNGTVCYVPAMQNGRVAPNPKYNHDKFKYDKKADCYICPEGQTLPFRQLSKAGNSVETGRVYYNNKVCRECPNKEKCTTNKRDGRKIYRNLYQDALDIVAARVQTDEARPILR